MSDQLEPTNVRDLYKEFLVEDPYVFNPPLFETNLLSQHTKDHSIADSTGHEFVADYRCPPESTQPSQCSTAAGIFGYYGVPYLTHHMALSDLQMQQQPFCQEMGIAPSALHGAPASSCHDSQTISAPPKGPALEDTRSPTSRAVLLPIGDRAQTFERAARGAATSLAGNQWQEKMQRHMADENSVPTLCGSIERKSAPSISRSRAPTKQRSPRARVGRIATTRVTRRTTKETDVRNLNCTEGHDIEAERRAVLSRVYVDDGGIPAREASSAREDVLLPSTGAMRRHPTVGSTTVQDIPSLAGKTQTFGNPKGFQTAFKMRCAPPPRQSAIKALMKIDLCLTQLQCKPQPGSSAVRSKDHSESPTSHAISSRKRCRTKETHRQGGDLFDDPRSADDTYDPETYGDLSEKEGDSENGRGGKRRQWALQGKPAHTLTVNVPPGRPHPSTLEEPTYSRPTDRHRRQISTLHDPILCSFCYALNGNAIRTLARPDEVYRHLRKCSAFHNSQYYQDQLALVVNAAQINPHEAVENPEVVVLKKAVKARKAAAVGVRCRNNPGYRELTQKFNLTPMKVETRLQKVVKLYKTDPCKCCPWPHISSYRGHIY